VAHEGIRGKHLQVVHFSGDLGFGDAVEKLADSWVSTGAQLLGRTECDDFALVNQEHAVSDQACARQFMRDDDDPHAASSLELQKKLGDAGCNDWVQSG